MRLKCVLVKIKNMELGLYKICLVAGGEVPDGKINSACMASTTPEPWSFHGKSYVISR